MTQVEVWNQSRFKRVQDQFQQGSLPHAILLMGPEGIGRETFAQSLAQWLLCLNRQQEACGKCKSCFLFEAGHHPDYHLLDIEQDKTQISVGQVRELIASMQESSHQGGWKVANIANVQAMNASSFNALLKTLEEPQDNTLLILQTSQLQGVPPTIRSRAQLLSLSVDEPQQVREWLTERQGHMTQALEAALNLFPQAPYKAEDFGVNGDTLKYAEFIVQMTDLVQGNQTPVQMAQFWHEELADVAFWMQLMVRDILLIQQTDEDGDLLFVQQKQELGLLAKAINGQGWLMLLEKINELQRLIKQKSPVNLMASWQSLLIFVTQIASKYKSLG
ncbi:DNA polymerase III subunit delta' [Kangiella profundi]|uniref:DNA polymerase III subunit delta' n=1 Tax=Kangiella profundi TaxID=1561924 RepID=A0A2K9ABI4_9GAMM|nr:DNA polymerase III subunit delta' [Kangiella profundi]AUD78777.1 DNA polymerase III subunit delta' [Kangiella profundi]GGF04309.1 DNA polymerase III subunit delta' [Kangiella profundi]